MSTLLIGTGLIFVASSIGQREWSLAIMGVICMVSEILDLKKARARRIESYWQQMREWGEDNQPEPSSFPGGFMTVASHADRDNIPAHERREGLCVLTREDACMWCLIGGVTNAHWLMVFYERDLKLRPIPGPGVNRFR